MNRLIGLLFCMIAPLAVCQQAPTVSTVQLDKDQLEVYRAFLRSYNNGSNATINLGSKTVPLRLSPDDLANCLKGMRFPSDSNPRQEVHPLGQEDFAGFNVRLVDAQHQSKIVEANDPQILVHQVIDRGVKVTNDQLDTALKKAFETGLLQVSEIIFDKERQHAVMAFSFECGSLCGNGATLVFEKVGGTWKQMKSQCTAWVSDLNLRDTRPATKCGLAGRSSSSLSTIHYSLSTK